MSNKNHYGIAEFLYVILNVFFIGGTLGMIFIPGLFAKFASDKSIIRYIIFAEAECLLSLLIIYELKNIMGKITETKIFNLDNVKSFSRIGAYTFILGAIYMIGDIVNKNFHIIYAFNKDGSLKLDIFVFIIVGCTFLTISEVLRKAINIKDENDLTI
ncbi:MAG: DUF2975 domain-containing protein [Clostridium sp.]|jgi:hypothetical protein|uniref:DUF2975 domain-containing protein n=1 Tax=Clostridium sp. TaxID=1506 RepID=UPI0025BE6D15|nr:DUF2975 domain-containing protein [Clostridium sp.]MCH3964119.1 DUF2975 domain-containing protein [Clostridium sp.]MCI1715300.1 DUF2975 domain-containing protein [Clostridium sp.]MCI1799909.1 DUF2975 domain-containing protein [Clostridium sp.]MCI1813483.1 DUF2975 domain-containing protein [Clostridium sp.]MCI1870727.1 DUF2975 domain-containing protein [Clostridium sp.]